MSQAQSPQELLALLQRFAQTQRRGPARENPSAADFDWSRPYTFTQEQTERMVNLSSRLAGRFTRTLAQAARVEVQVEAGEPRLYYQRVLKDIFGQRDGYTVTLLDEAKAPCGQLWLSSASATEWVGKLLGAASGAGGDRNLSSLESALLGDVVNALVESLNETTGRTGGKGLRAAGELIRQYAPPAGDGAQEYGELSFFAQASHEIPSMALLLPSAYLAAVLGGDSVAQSRRPAEDLRRDMVKHLELAPVSGQVWLGNASIAVRDLMELEPGDVLLLETCVGEPVDFVIEGKTVLSGTPAACQGNYALQVVRRAQPSK